jgi:hypothetical protein
MSIYSGPNKNTSGLVFCFDAANIKSYPGSGSVVSNIISKVAGETINNPTFSTDGFFSFATNTIMRFPEDSSLNTQTVSVEVFLRTNNLNQNGFWFEKGNVNTQYALFQQGGNILWRANTGSVVNLVSLVTANFLNTADWFHIVATFVSGNQYMYINGNQVGSGTIIGTLATNTNGMSVGVYGGFNGSRSYYYDGDIAVVRVYNRVLNADEVKQNFNALKGRFRL